MNSEHYTAYGAKVAAATTTKKSACKQRKKKRTNKDIELEKLKFLVNYDEVKL